LVHYAGYTEKEMKETVDYMLENLKKPVKYEAMFKKYAQRKFMKASVFCKEWVEKECEDKQDEVEEVEN
jgi:G2/mitotic-specific cyclin 1/2